MFSFLLQRFAANHVSSQVPRRRRSQSTSMLRSRTFGNGFESLEYRSMLSATTIEVEPNNNAATANIAQFDPADGAAQIVGTIATRKDRDFFQFTAPSSGSVQLAVHGDPGLVTKVEVENSRRDEVFETEPHDGVDSGSFAVEAGQTYTLRVEGKDKTIGAYTVDLVLSNATSPANGGTDEQNEDGPNDRGHDVGDDRIAVALAAPAAKLDDHGADRQNDRGNEVNDVRREDRQNDRNKQVADDRLTAALAASTTKVDDHGADRRNDAGNDVNDVKHEDRQLDRRNDRRNG